MKRCCTCKRNKDLDDFNKSGRSKDGRQPQCRQCSKDHYAANREQYAQRIQETKRVSRTRAQRYVWDYLLSHPCVDCPEADPVVLEFDHVRGVKVNNVAVMIHKNVPLWRIQAEIEKCEVRCANCHRRKTAAQFDWYAWAVSTVDESLCSSDGQSVRLLSASA